MSSGGTGHPVERLRSVYLHSTPLAMFLVGMGAAFSPISGPECRASLGLLAASLLFNSAVILSPRALSHAGLVQARMAVNFCVNCVLVYVLGRYWEPVWLLLLLTPLAAALYYDRRRTAFTAAGTAVELLAINLVRGTQGPVTWPNQFVYAAAIVVLPLLVQDVARTARAGSR